MSNVGNSVGIKVGILVDPKDGGGSVIVGGIFVWKDEEGNCVGGCVRITSVGGTVVVEESMVVMVVAVVPSVVTSMVLVVVVIDLV